MIDHLFDTAFSSHICMFGFMFMTLCVATDLSGQKHPSANAFYPRMSSTIIPSLCYFNVPKLQVTLPIIK